MKLFIILIAFTAMCSSCASHNGLTTNTNVHTTEVTLTKSNFEVVDIVEGSARALYIFGIGGLGKKALVAKARRNMFEDANLIGKPRALINENVEVKYSKFPLIRVHQITVSGQVIEFQNERDERNEGLLTTDSQYD